MSDDSAYQKVLRLIGRGRDEYGSVPLLLGDILLVKKDEYRLFKELVKSSHGKINSFRIFSLKELQKATNNFNADQILHDSYPTYRGIIEDRHVAVKICTLHTLLNEVVSLSLIKHRNVVKLLGCCLETENPIVVHELPPNGTLRENISKLSWTDRLRIATEIADAVVYLHSELNITHLRLWDDQAVLLDEFNSAKLGAFHNSKIQNQAESSDAKTDIRNKFRKLKDVYTFGRILLNLLDVYNLKMSTPFVYRKEEERRAEVRNEDRKKKGRGTKEGKFVRYVDKEEILKYLKLNVSEKEMPQMKAYIDLFLRCRSSLDKVPSMEEDGEDGEDGEDKVRSMEEVARELRRIRSMMNHQPTKDGNESHNLSSGANASTSYHEVTSD